MRRPQPQERIRYADPVLSPQLLRLVRRPGITTYPGITTRPETAADPRIAAHLGIAARPEIVRHTCTRFFTASTISVIASAIGMPFFWEPSR